jgi:DNA repair protein RadC
VEAGSLAALLSWTPADYRRMKGVSHTKGLQLAVIAEIGRRMLMSPTPTPLLDRPELVAAHLAPVASGLLVEKFWVLCLNRKGRLIKQVEITSGTATATLAPPRDVFRAAIQVSASALICAHNHPGGDPIPSSADINVTRALCEASKTVQIELLDHVIVGSPTLDPRGVGHFSFKAAGLL